MATEILILGALIFVNGFFSMAEMAIVSTNKTRLRQRVEDGSDRARTALALAENPTPFLSTIQVGITLIGILMGVFAEAALAEELIMIFDQYAWLASYSETVSAAIIVIIITYLSVVIGELVPKRLALGNSERIAISTAPLMLFFSKAATPVVNLLTASTEVVLRLLKVKLPGEPTVTEEEIKILIDQGTSRGVFEEVEQEIVERVFRLSDRLVSSLMTHRLQMVWLDVDDSFEDNMRKVIASGHSNFVVCRGSLENIVGITRAKDLLALYLNGRPDSIMTSSQPPPVIPKRMKALDALERLREEKSPLALVVDEYGAIAGMITFADVLEAIVGDIPGMDNVGDEPEATRREDGSWLFDGRMAIHDLQIILGLDKLPAQDAHYETVGGMFMAYLDRIPAAGDGFEWDGLRFEVVDMDGHRVDKVLVAPISSTHTIG